MVNWNLAPLRSAIGMIECWNNGILGLGNWGNGLEEEEWLADNPLLSAICRISAAYF
jgi:hypothetical protein